MERRHGLILAVQILVLALAVGIAVLNSTAASWQPVELVLLLGVMAVGSDLLIVDVRGVRITGSFLAVVLAMALLGPAPAASIGAGAALLDALISRLAWQKGLNNVVVWAVFPAVGGVMVGALAGEGHTGLDFAGVVLLTFMVTNFLNFLGVASLIAALPGGQRLVESLRSVYATVLPAEFATGLLTAGVALSYSRVGVGAVGLLAVVLLVFQNLFRAGVHAYERGEELERRARELASLQVGLLTTVLQTLSMRDAMTARHSAAVARYARGMAEMLHLDEREQDLIHTAALLHDIGKFIFPDSILTADRKLTDDEWQIVRLHPEQGAQLVRRIEGYGPVADIVHAHHEKVDGTGYPLGLSGEEIPLGSRIIAVCDTYDVITARDSYRRPVSSADAIRELRRVAGRQLDAELVETFVTMIETRRIAFRHADEADFEKELAFERRVEAYARPRAAAA